MQTAAYQIWTQAADSISTDGNSYLKRSMGTVCASKWIVDVFIWYNLLQDSFLQLYSFMFARVQTWLIDFNCMVTLYGGARGVMVIVIGNGHGDMSSNPGRDWLRFT